MTTRIISYKKVDMTDDEYSEYQKICRSYDRPNFKGEDLFKDLFETNDDGLITYIKSLNNRQITFEILFFVMNLMQNQWLRLTVNNANSFLIDAERRLQEKLSILDTKIKELDKQ